MKTVTDVQLHKELGETLVKAKFHRLGLVFEGRGRLETGIDGTIADIGERAKWFIRQVALFWS